ncbi:MAG: hypothetical protein Q9213_004478 [Squamulea squamosa]
MAAQKDSKLIFAPAGTDTSFRADQYTKNSLSRSQLSPSPFTQFHTWFTHAASSSVPVPETVCFSTAHLPSGSQLGHESQIRGREEQCEGEFGVLVEGGGEAGEGGGEV